MSAFRFRLERVLAVRRTELELEEAAFERHSAEIARLDHARAAVQAEGLRAEAQIRRWSPVTGNDLAALSEFRLASRARENELALRRAEGERRRAEQKLKMLEARRRCRRAPQRPPLDGVAERGRPEARGVCGGAVSDAMGPPAGLVTLRRRGTPFVWQSSHFTQ